MRLSEAIRLWAMLHPQYFGATYGMDVNHQVLGTCAMGAARQAGFIVRREGVLDIATRCPHCGKVRDALLRVITHLNDGHRWTRERIADWVATVEPAETTDPHATTSDEGVLIHAHC